MGRQFSRCYDIHVLRVRDRDAMQTVLSEEFYLVGEERGVRERGKERARGGRGEGFMGRK